MKIDEADKQVVGRANAYMHACIMNEFGGVGKSRCNLEIGIQGLN